MIRTFALSLTILMATVFAGLSVWPQTLPSVRYVSPKVATTGAWLVVRKTLVPSEDGKLMPSGKWRIELKRYAPATPSSSSNEGNLEITIDPSLVRKTVGGTGYIFLQPGSVTSFTDAFRPLPGVESPFSSLYPRRPANKV